MAAPPVLAALVAAGIDAPAWATVTAVVLGALAAAALTLHFVVRPLGHLVATARLDAADLGAATEHLRGLLEVRDRFEAAAVAVDAEPTLLRLAVRAVHEIVQDHDVALLLSLPEEHRVAWRVRSLDGELLPAEPAPSRPGCTALATERTAIADSIHRLGACEHLQGPDADDVSAVCIPLRLGDRSLGSVCVTGPPGEVPSADDVAALEHLVTTTGRRLGELRHRHGPSTPGPTDPVTGLPGEAALRSRAGELVRSQIPYCVAILRIDGAMFFGVSDRIESQIPKLESTDVVILRLSRVGVMDATGAKALADIALTLREAGIEVLIKGIDISLVALIEEVGVIETIGGRDHLFTNLDEALRAAEMIVEARAEA